jgi:hypothetical protein
MKITKAWIQEKEWALQDLLHIKHTGRYNEYVTADNIDDWIKLQSNELKNNTNYRGKNNMKTLKQIGKAVGIIIVGIFVLAMIFGDDTETTQEPAATQEVKEVKNEDLKKEEKKVEKTKEEIKAEEEAKAKKEAEEKAKAEQEAQAQAERDAKQAEQDAIDNYSSFMQDHTSRFQNVMVRFSEQFGNATFTDEWKIDTVVVLFEMQELVKEARDVNDVPSVLQPTHDKYMQAMDKYDTVAKGLPTALDNMDTNEINRLAGIMNEANVNLQEATVELQNAM